jgi:exodeoxyribonuclease VII small subunit
MPTPEKEKPGEPTFEEAMGSLEKIVAEMESDTLPLEDLLVRYEQGLKLVKLCGDKLEAAEKKIELITRTAGGKAKAVDFPEAGTPHSTPPPVSVTEKDSAAPKSPTREVRLF